MKLWGALTILIRMFLGMAIALPTFHPGFRHIPYGMDEFWPLIGGKHTDVMPLSKNLTQIQRLYWADKCMEFRHKCKMAEHCCSQRCLKRIQRCIT
ncbi:uncharacterized protein LOC108099308 [Drosophila ficusphila]|uniref:uncharacterized protein LOC108099308 n=1 Tax=Drosophila ficusphila TaxID=30025 RepID=UPI0007E87E7A|nr:uncharacterized protein LOC108099308 [Drosophila ficusphila]